MIAYCTTQYIYIIYINKSKLFFTLIINSNIIIYKLDFFINIIILKFLIKRIFLFFA